MLAWRTACFGSPAVAEAWLFVATAGYASFALARISLVPEAVLLLLTAPLCVLLPFLRRYTYAVSRDDAVEASIHSTLLGVACRYRRGADAGLTIGTLLLPCLFAALAVQARTDALAAQAAAVATGRCASIDDVACLAAASAEINAETDEFRLAIAATLSFGTWVAMLSQLRIQGLAIAWSLITAVVLSAVFDTGAAIVGVALFAASAVILLGVLLRLPYVFTLGEATVVSQAIAFVLVDACLVIAHAGSRPPPSPTHLPADRRAAWVVVCQMAFLTVAAIALVTWPLLHRISAMQRRRIAAAAAARPLVATPTSTRPVSYHTHDDSDLADGDDVQTDLASYWSWKPILAWYALVAVLVFGVAAPLTSWLIQDNVFVWLAVLAFGTPLHQAFLVFWAVAVAFTVLALLLLRRSMQRVPLILVRKVFHALVLVMFVPAILSAIELLRVAFGGALAVFLFLEMIRFSRLPPFGATLADFLERFIDERDAGPVITTHIYLLLGCAVPVWVSALESPASTEVVACAGVFVLGVGDSVASLVGTRYGRHKWLQGRKSVEGTCGAVLVMLAVAAMAQLCSSSSSSSSIFSSLGSSAAFALATTATCLLEAFTWQVDNLVLPVYYLILLMLNAAVATPIS